MIDFLPQAARLSRSTPSDVLRPCGPFCTFSLRVAESRGVVNQNKPVLCGNPSWLWKIPYIDIRRPRPAARGMAPGKRMLPPLAATTITTTTTTRTTRRRTTTTTTTTTTATTTIAATLHYTTIHEFNCSTLQLQMQIQLQLHYFTLQYTRLHYTIPRYGTQHYSTLQYTTLITPHDNYNCNCNYTTLVTLHYNYNLQVQLHYTTTSSH